MEIKLDSPEFIELSKKNRRDFLEPYRIQCEQIQNAIEEAEEMPKSVERANEIRKLNGEIEDIIISLLKIEPSHVHESWISDIVEDWQALDKPVTLSGKGAITRAVKPSNSRMAILFFRIKIHHERMLRTFGSRNRWKRRIEYSIDAVLSDWNNKHPGNMLSHDYMRRRYYEIKKAGNFEFNKIELPYPYWGRHVKQKPGGGFEFRANVTITQGDQVLGHTNLKFET